MDRHDSSRTQQAIEAEAFQVSDPNRIRELVGELSVAIETQNLTDDQRGIADASLKYIPPSGGQPHPEPLAQEHQESAFAVVRRAGRAVTQFYDLVLAPTGLKATQFVILQAIREAGEIAQCDFAREFGIAVPTLSRRFGGLRKKEFIQIRKGPRHGERIYSLTARGEEVYTKALPYWERAQFRLRTALGEDDWSSMLRLADRIRSAALDAEELRTGNRPPASSPESALAPVSGS